MHRGRAFALALLIGTVLVLILQIAFPADDAEAIAPLVIAGMAGLGALIGGGMIDAAADTASDSISSWLRTWINTNLDQANNALTRYLTDGGMLTRDFDQLFSSVVPMLKGIQSSVVIPLAMVVLMTFLIIGLGNVITAMNRNEAGVDVWQLCMVFISFTFISAVITNSWELMELAYDLVCEVIRGIGATVNGEYYSGIPDEVENVGVLLSLLMTSGVVWVIANGVALLTQVIIIARAVQLYVYTCLAPVSLAFLTAESARPMATGFLKRYLALLFAGVIMAVLFAMMSAILSGFGSMGVAASGYEDTIDWAGHLMFSCVSLLAYGYCMWSAGGWAREFVGI